MGISLTKATDSSKIGRPCRVRTQQAVEVESDGQNIYYHPGSDQEFIGRGYGPDVWENLRQMKGGNIDKNIYFNAGTPDSPAILKKMHDLGHDKNSAYVDPLFVDWRNGDFRLKPDSPALKMGIKSVDISKAGLTKDFPKRFKRN